MREHYDFSKMKGRKNPYIKSLGQTASGTASTPDDTKRGQE